jgi:hypothetical protein
MNLNFKLNIVMRFEKPVSMLENNIYPGVCRMSMFGQPVVFDFGEVSWFVDENDNCLVYLEHQAVNYVNEDITEEMCKNVDYVNELIFITDMLDWAPVSVEKMEFTFDDEKICIAKEAFEKITIFNHLTAPHK